MSQKKSPSQNLSSFVVAFNKTAKMNYIVLDTWEAGLLLKGSEVKSLRHKRCQIKDAYVVFYKEEVYLHHLHISPYPPAGKAGHATERKRKLLLNKNEIHKLLGQIQLKGLSCIPLKIYFKNSKAKAQIALVKGRKKHDKREYLKKKDAQKSLHSAVRKSRRL